MALLNPCAERDRIRDRWIHTQHVKPIAYRHPGAGLRRIARAWADSGIPGRPHLVDAAPFLVSVTNGGEIRYHPTRDPAVWFEIGDPVYRIGGDLRHFDLGTPGRTGNRLRWITQHLRMDYVHLGHAGKLAMLFRTDAYQQVDDREIAFPITYRGCQRDGSRILVAGQTVMTMHPFRAYDHAGDHDHNPIPVPHDFRVWQGTEYVIVTLPAAMDAWDLPVLDPTLETQPDETAGEDCFMNSGNAGANYNTTELKYDAKNNGALIQFDVSSIPSGSTVTSATLETYQKANCGAHTIMCHAILVDWVETEASWLNRKSGTAWNTAGCLGSGTDVESSSQDTCPSGGGNNWLDWDVQDAVARHVSGALTNNGFRILTDGEGGWGGPVAHSSAHTTASQRPKLTVEYTLPASSASAPMLRRQRH
jgi:hypothetical protein